MFACSHRSTARTRTGTRSSKTCRRVCIYPLLKRLESAGLLTVYAIEHNGRLRKYYRITPAGVTYLDEFLKDWDDVLDVYEYVKRGANR